MMLPDLEVRLADDPSLLAKLLARIKAKPVGTAAVEEPEHDTVDLEAAATRTSSS